MLVDIIVIYLVIGLVWALKTLYSERKTMICFSDGVAGFLCNLIAWPLSVIMAWLGRGLGGN